MRLEAADGDEPYRIVPEHPPPAISRRQFPEADRVGATVRRMVGVGHERVDSGEGRRGRVNTLTAACAGASGRQRPRRRRIRARTCRRAFDACHESLARACSVQRKRARWSGTRSRNSSCDSRSADVDFGGLYRLLQISRDYDLQTSSGHGPSHKKQRPKSLNLLASPRGLCRSRLEAIPSSRVRWRGTAADAASRNAVRSGRTLVGVLHPLREHQRKKPPERWLCSLASPRGFEPRLPP